MKLALPKRSVERVVPRPGDGETHARQMSEMPFLQSRTCYPLAAFGAVAQLGERCVRNAEVEGSTPFRST